MTVLESWKALEAHASDHSRTRFLTMVDRDGVDTHGRSLLHHASEAGNAACVNSLLSWRGAGVDRAGHDGNTPLMEAAAEGHIPVVRLLVAHKARMDIANAEGDTALMLAATCGREGTVQYLVGRGANVHRVNESGLTAVMLATTSGNLQIVEALLRAGADPDHATAEGVTALMLAARDNHGLIAEHLMDASGARQQGGHEHGTRYVHANDGDVLGPSAPSAQAALLVAAQARNLDVVDVLLDRGVGVHYQNARGVTPLMAAATNGDTEMACRLMEAGARINTVNRDGQTPLDLALFESYDETAHAMRHLAIERELGAHPALKASLSCAFTHSLFSGDGGDRAPFLSASGQTFARHVAKRALNPMTDEPWGAPRPKPNARMEAVMRTLVGTYDGGNLPDAVQRAFLQAVRPEATLLPGELDASFIKFVTAARQYLEACHMDPMRLPGVQATSVAGVAASQSTVPPTYQTLLASHRSGTPVAGVRLPAVAAHRGTRLPGSTGAGL